MPAQMGISYCFHCCLWVQEVPEQVGQDDRNIWFYSFENGITHILVKERRKYNLRLSLFIPGRPNQKSCTWEL